MCFSVPLLYVEASFWSSRNGLYRCSLKTTTTKYADWFSICQSD